jgi:hypothetical protein
LSKFFLSLLLVISKMLYFICDLFLLIDSWIIQETQKWVFSITNYLMQFI